MAFVSSLFPLFYHPALQPRAMSLHPFRHIVDGALRLHLALFSKSAHVSSHLLGPSLLRLPLLPPPRFAFQKTRLSSGLLTELSSGRSGAEDPLEWRRAEPTAAPKHNRRCIIDHVCDLTSVLRTTLPPPPILPAPMHNSCTERLDSFLFF